MKKLIQSFIELFYLILITPHLLILFFHKDRGMIHYEISTWLKVIRIDKKGLPGLLFLMKNIQEFRSVFYFRLGSLSKPLNLYLPKPATTFFMMPKEQVGFGLVLQHGFSTIVNAKRIGVECQIWHNVTIGLSESGTQKKPTIGNNVKICAGAILLGDIVVGDNSIIGAGAVVTKNVPSNVTIVGNPPFIVKFNGEKVNQRL